MLSSVFSTDNKFHEKTEPDNVFLPFCRCLKHPSSVSVSADISGRVRHFIFLKRLGSFLQISDIVTHKGGNVAFMWQLFSVAQQQVSEHIPPSATGFSLICC